MQKHLIRRLLPSTFSLLCGGLIYILFRQPLPIVSAIFRLQQPLIDLDALPFMLRAFILYHLPDALFAFSMTAGLCLLFNRGTVVCLFVIVYICLFETAQFLSIVPGIGDWLDVLFSVISVAIYKFLEGKNHEQKTSQRPSTGIGSLFHRSGGGK